MITEPFREVAVAYFGALDRSPDSGGLGYWGGSVRLGHDTIVHVAEQLVATAEFSSLHAGQDRTTIIESFYTHGLGRDPDAAGVSYWDHSGASLGQVLAAMATSAEAIDHNVWALERIDLAIWGHTDWPTAVDRTIIDVSTLGHLPIPPGE